MHSGVWHFARHFSTNAELITSTVLNGVHRIVLNSPRTRNALSLDMMRALRASMAEAQANPEVRAIVLAGNGPAFSAGHNMKHMTAQDGAKKHQEIFDCCNALMMDIVKADVPVIAAVDGIAAAAGCQLVAMCDIALATKTSTFSTPGSGFGIFCSTPGIPLARSVPRKVSSYMLLTGKPITAQEALQAGLLSKVTLSDTLDEEVEDTCHAIANKPKAVVALGKKFYYQQLEMGLSEALTKGGEVMVDNLRYKDAQEGILAFKEKRPPLWTHSDSKL